MKIPKTGGTEGFYLKDGKKQDIELHTEALNHVPDAEDQEETKARLRAEGCSEELVNSFFKGPTKLEMAMAKKGLD